MRGVADYWAGAIAEARTPIEVAVDGLRWWQLMTERRPAAKSLPQPGPHG